MERMGDPLFGSSHPLVANCSHRLREPVKVWLQYVGGGCYLACLLVIRLLLLGYVVSAPIPVPSFMINRFVDLFFSNSGCLGNSILLYPHLI